MKSQFTITGIIQIPCHAHLQFLDFRLLHLLLQLPLLKYSLKRKLTLYLWGHICSQVGQSLVQDILGLISFSIFYKFSTDDAHCYC